LEGRVLLAVDMLTPVADAFVRDPSFNATNFGASDFLYVKTAGSGDSRVAYLKFDVSNWSADQIGNATLYLTGALQTPTTPPITAAIYPVAASNWVEGDGDIAVRNRSGGGGGTQLTGTAIGDGYDTDNSPAGEITWDNGPAIVGGPLAQADVTRETFQTYAFDLTAYIQQQRQAGNNLISVAVQGTQPTAHMIRFLSREFDGGGRPLLVLTDPNDADGSAVRAAVNAPDLITGGVASHTVTVTYTGTAAIDVSTIDASDLTVTRDGGSNVQVTGVTFDPPFNSSSVTATYTIDAPGQTWEATDNDLYTINVRRGEVRDVGGNELVPSFNSFRAKVFDAIAPTASVNAAPITTGGASTYSFTVTYADNIAFDVGTINVNNVSVTTPGGGQIQPTNVTFTSNANDTQVVATYTVPAPGGDWGAEDNGAYSITLHTQTARDTAANEVAEFVTPLSVAIQGPDVTNPTAAISAQNVVAPSTGTHTVTVVYTDDRSLNANSIGTNDIAVTGPRGEQLGVTGVTLSPGGTATTQTATYTIAPPAGGWTSDANGVYTVSLNAGAVTDSAGNAAQAATGTFSVQITPPPPPDTTPPGVSINAVNLTTGGGVQHSITVTYTDNVALKSATFTPDDITVTGPGGATFGASGLQVNPAGDTTPVSVTYQIDAPGGTWGPEDDGNYTITVNAGAVSDTTANANAAVSAGFTVDIGGPDTSGPSGAISATNVDAPGAATHQVTITYTDGSKVAANSIDVGDITVVRTDGLVLQVTATSVTPNKNDSPLTAIYTLAAPGGTWDGLDDGIYTVTLLPGAVQDTKHNLNAGATATFTVNATVVDVAPPTASVQPIAPITAASDTPLTVVVTYSDNQPMPTSVFGADDLVITGPTGPLAATGSVTVTPGADPNAVTVTYQFAPPGGTWDVSDKGTYTVALAQGAVTDAAGNPATLATPVTFAVDVPAPSPIDPAFGAGTPIPTNFVTEGVVAQPDGKLVLVGRRGTAGAADSQGVIQRRNADGTPDTTFGGGDGEVTTDAGQGAIFYAVGLQSDGRIVVAGTMNGDFMLSRYDVAGNPDASFGSNGRLLSDFGADGEAAFALAIGPDDKIVLGGTSADHFAFARFTPAGNLDPTFGQGGKNLFDADGVDVVGALAIDSAGRILAAGASGANVVLIRLGVNGEQDMSFAGDSILIVPGLVSRPETGLFVDHSQALVVQGDGNILVGNFTAAGSNFGVARVTPAGALDPSFGNDGIATADFGGNDDVDSLLIQETGEIIAVGTTDSGGTPVTAVAAFDRAGKPITGFATGGLFAFNPGVSNPAREVHIGDLVLRAFGTRQADGRLVVTSTDRSPTPTSSSLVRLLVPGTRQQPQGTLIGTFGAVPGAPKKGARFVDTVTGAVFTMKGGSGQAFRGEDGRINLVLTDGGAGVTVVIKSKGRIPLGDVVCAGTIRSMQVKTGDLSGTMFVRGMLGKLQIGNVAGTIAVNGAITSIVADSLTNAKILSGANLGDDAELGGAVGTSNADTFGVGVIGSVKVRGAIAQSIVGAGLNPVDDVYGDDDDVVTPGSTIRTLSAKSADPTSRFYASTFKSVKLPKKIKDVASDARFKTA
jgi:uncharacterized delta-60 repeat protein